MAKPVGMGHMVEGHMLKVVDRVEVAAVVKMAGLEVVLALSLVSVKLVGMGHMVEDHMLKEAARVEEAVAGKMVDLDKDLVLAQVTIKLVDTILIIAVDMLMQVTGGYANAGGHDGRCRSGSRSGSESVNNRGGCP
jgi:hypothetical protein